MRVVLNDPLLAARPSANAADAQSALYTERRISMTRLAYLLTGSVMVGEELFHDAFEQVVRGWDLIERPDVYLRLAVVHGARSWRRRQHSLPGDPLPDHHMIDGDAIAVRDALGDLRHDEREVLVLRYYAGMTDSEIASLLERPLGTVKSQIYRGLSRMREVLT
jgi:RNA polymerase sigma factor (sigma-70 family)